MPQSVALETVLEALLSENRMVVDNQITELLTLILSRVTPSSLVFFQALRVLQDKMALPDIQFVVEKVEQYLMELAGKTTTKPPLNSAFVLGLMIPVFEGLR